MELILEIVVLTAIIVELISLARHAKLDRKVDNHMKALDDHMKILDDHMKALDDHMKRSDSYLVRLNDYFESNNKKRH